MPPPPPTRPALQTPALRRAALTLAALLVLGASARAQISFSSAVGLALNSSPRVRMAHDDVVKAHGALAESHDAYLPVVSGAVDLGYSYGAPIGEPTLFSFNAHSLAFNFSQKDYIRAAHQGLDAANLAYSEVRQEVAEDVAVTYIALDLAQQRSDALAQQYGYANRLAAIVQERLDAGQDTRIELLKAQHTVKEIHVLMLELDDEIDTTRTHLALLIGLPGSPIVTIPGSIPPLPATILQPAEQAPASAQPSFATVPDTPGIAAEFANARAKHQQAIGDARYRYRPEVAFFTEYSRFSTFNNYQLYYPAFSNNTLNAIAIGIQVSIPFFDRGHQDRALESSADAAHAHEQALYDRQQFLEGHTKLQHSSDELAARADLADTDQQLAQMDLDAILVRLQDGTGNSAGPQLSPKDEQNARIQERQKFIDLLDAQSKLRQAQVQLLRQNGQLEDWIKSATPPHRPAAPLPAPRSSVPPTPAPYR
jgi:outer membrane protein TolC